MSQNLKIQNQRNYGIDLLRLVAGFYIVLIHAIGQGGVLANVPEGTLAYSILWALQICGNCGVDIFILISGYVSIREKNSKGYLRRLLLLWLEVFFYNVLGYFFFHLVYHQSIQTEDILKLFFPVTNTTYWYFSILVGFSAIQPLLDVGICELDEHRLKTIFVIISALFCFYPVFYGGFGIIDGFSVIWFVVLYSLGAIARKCGIGENLSASKLIIMICLLILLTWLWKMSGFEFNVLGKSIGPDSLLPYSSPTIAGIAFLHLLLFSKMKFSSIFQRIIRFAAPSAFAIYLLNTQPDYWRFVLRDRFLSLANRRISVILPRIFLYVIGFVIAAVLIDKVRQFIFSKLIPDKR